MCSKGLQMRVVMNMDLLVSFGGIHLSLEEV